jgi:hypothetical protein
MADADAKRGLYRKYFVQRLDEKDAGPDVILNLRAMEVDARQPPAPRCGCREAMCPHVPFPAVRWRNAAAPAKHSACRYFVLDLDHDPFAAPALRAYAAACAAEYPALAADLLRLAAPIPEAPAPGHPAAEEE